MRAIVFEIHRPAVSAVLIFPFCCISFSFPGGRQGTQITAPEWAVDGRWRLRRRTIDIDISHRVGRVAGRAGMGLLASSSWVKDTSACQFGREPAGQLLISRGVDRDV